MKKCKDCKREIDKYAIACEYCGKLAKKLDQATHSQSPEKSPTKEPKEKD